MPERHECLQARLAGGTGSAGLITHNHQSNPYRQRVHLFDQPTHVEVNVIRQAPDAVPYLSEGRINTPMEVNHGGTPCESPGYKTALPGGFLSYHAGLD